MQDITGNRYGKWTVIERTDKFTKHDGVKYLCECDCGTIKEVSEKSLIYGKSNSFGCVRKDRFSKMVDGMKGINHPSFKDLTGRKFGFLTAIKPTDKKSGSNIVWECKCDCGNICYAPSAALLSGKKTNCGCKRIKDMTGQKFGMLTVVEQAGILCHGEMSWKCKCECGKETVVLGSLLRNGGTKSCGCLHKISAQKLRKHNEFEVCGDTVCVIVPPNNKQMFCDIEDWEKLSVYCWFEDKSGYAYANVNRGKKKTVRFHQMLFDAPSGMTVDHINRNKLDNRKENIRVVTITENVLNRDVYKNNTSGARGVTWNRVKRKWQVRLTWNKKVVSLGYFDNIEDAKKARLEGEIKYFGELIDDKPKKSC